jgi:hypothetical protein
MWAERFAGERLPCLCKIAVNRKVRNALARSPVELPQQQERAVVAAPALPCN